MTNLLVGIMVCLQNYFDSASNKLRLLVAAFATDIETHTQSKLSGLGNKPTIILKLDTCQKSPSSDNICSRDGYYLPGIIELIHNKFVGNWH